MSSKGSAKPDAPVVSKKAYMELLRNTLRTDVESKAAHNLSKAMGDHHQQPSKVTNTLCTLSSAVKQNNSCILKIRQMSDNVLVALMLVSSHPEKKENTKEGQELARAVQSLITLTAEVVAISTRFHETAFGLHIVTDFFRYPFDLTLLNFSSSGRVSLPHFSHIEASIMRLTWLHGAIEKALEEQRALLSLEHLKIYSSFQQALMDLRDASNSTSQVFRILMYCNPEGKSILQEFVHNLQPPERNDIILELNQLRVQHEEISKLLERVGWSLTDIWKQYTGKNISFEKIHKESKARTEPLWTSRDQGTPLPVPTAPKEVHKTPRKKKRGKKNKKGKSKKELFFDRLVTLFGRKPLDIISPQMMLIPPVGNPSETEGADDSKRPPVSTVRKVKNKTRMRLLKSFSSTTKISRVSAAHKKFMRLKERGWK